MKTTIYPSKSRGKADFGWLKANYSFSFNSYYNPEQIHFGKLRVLNDDTISGGAGFDTHPHANMEIITIPLKGAIAHEDSTGAKGVIRPGEVQLMSAGSGIEHSERNHITNGETQLLQIWIFPKETNTPPKYQQQYFDDVNRKDQWQYIVSNKHHGALDINQDAVLCVTDLGKVRQLNYSKQYANNGAFLFIIDGKVIINNQEVLNSKDAIGIENFEDITLTSITDSKILVIEVPMN